MVHTMCTWQDCNNVATKPQIGSDGKAWANLCDEHDKEFSDNLLDPKGVLRCWVRAQGGAKKAVERMKPAIDTSVRLARFLTTVKGQK